MSFMFSIPCISVAKFLIQHRERGFDMTENNDEQKDSSDSKPRAFVTIEERLAKKRQKASLSKIIVYIVIFILVVILMLWLRHRAMSYR